jgi:hypothetical protein
VTPIRPQQPAPIAPQGAAPSDAGRLSAQKAFFALAMGQGQPAPAVTEPAAASVPAPVNRTAGAPAEAPVKILRPGSLLDIRV